MIRAAAAVAARSAARKPSCGERSDEAIQPARATLGRFALLAMANALWVGALRSGPAPRRQAARRKSPVPVRPVSAKAMAVPQKPHSARRRPTYQ